MSIATFKYIANLHLDLGVGEFWFDEYKDFENLSDNIIYTSVTIYNISEISTRS